MENTSSSGGSATQESAAPKSAKKKATKAKAKATTKKAASSNGGGKTFRPDSKRGKVITLASKDGGVTKRALMKATDWEMPELNAALARIKSYQGLDVKVEGEGENARVTVTGELQTRKPFSFEPKAQLKAHKPGTKRAKVLELMLAKDGVSFEEIMKKTGWDTRTAYEGIRLIHGYLGYGISQDKDGKIHAYQGKAKDAPVPAPKEPKPAKAKKAAKKAAGKGKSTAKKAGKGKKKATAPAAAEGSAPAQEEAPASSGESAPAAE